MKYTPSLSMSRSLRRTLEDSGEERAWHGWRVSQEEREALVSDQRQDKDQAKALDVSAGLSAVRGAIPFCNVSTFLSGFATLPLYAKGDICPCSP